MQQTCQGVCMLSLRRRWIILKRTTVRAKGWLSEGGTKTSGYRTGNYSESAGPGIPPDWMDEELYPDGAAEKFYGPGHRHTDRSGPLDRDHQTDECDQTDPARRPG